MTGSNIYKRVYAYLDLFCILEIITIMVMRVIYRQSPVKNHPINYKVDNFYVIYEAICRIYVSHPMPVYKPGSPTTNLEQYDAQGCSSRDPLSFSWL